MPQVMKLFRYTKKIKRQNLEIEQSPEVIKVALVQCNLVDNQYQQNKSCIYFLAIDRRNL